MRRRDFFRAGLAGSTAAGATRSSISREVRASETFKAGFAEKDITPEFGMEQPGGYGKSYLDEFHDPCKVRIAVFDDGSTTVVLVGVDAGSVGRDLVLNARREIEAACGIPGHAVMIGASHSHSSGPVNGIHRGEYDHASSFVQKLAYEHTTCADPRYVRQVTEQIVAGVRLAWKQRRPAACSVGSGKEEKAAYNRRFRMKNGLTYTHPRQGNPDIVEVAGPIDPEVGVVGAWDEEGGLIGCIVNYACHATTNPGGISANWIYYMERVIRGMAGADIPVVFLQGASGDVTQVDNLSPYRRKSGKQEAIFVGGRIGAEATRVLLSSYPGALTPVAAAMETFDVQRRIPDPERVRRCYEIASKDPAEVDRTEWTFAKEIVLLDALIAKSPVVPVEVQAIQLGPAVFISNPAELFCEFGLQLKERSPFQFTYPVELANGSVGYVPTEEALGPNGGGYETRLTRYSHLEATAGQQMVDTGLELAREMTPGNLPEPPRAEPFRAEPGSIGSQPWDYGNLPPELE